jgi:uncharacterized OsmC-like protein
MPKIKARAIWVENVRSIADNSRAHSVVCDLPLAAGGGDSGPTALELSLEALADCGVTIFADICKRSNINLGKVDIVVEAEKSSESPAIAGVTMKVCVSAQARKELLEGAWRRTEAYCPVFLIFKNQTPVRVEFETKTE